MILHTVKMLPLYLIKYILMNQVKVKFLMHRWSVLKNVNLIILLFNLDCLILNIIV